MRSGAAGGQARRRSRAGRTLRGSSGMERGGAPPCPPPHDEIAPGVKPAPDPPPHFPHGQEGKKKGLLRERAGGGARSPAADSARPRRQRGDGRGRAGALAAHTRGRAHTHVGTHKRVHAHRHTHT